MSKLPRGWEFCELELVAEDINYGYTAKSDAAKGNARMLRITDIQDNRVNWSAVPYCEISEPNLKKYALRKSDLVFARTGATVGKSYLIQEEPTDTVFASYLIRVRPTLKEMAGYLYHFFGSASYWSQIIEMSAGIGQPNVNGSKLKQLRVPVAPLPEQKRIADKLDTVLARVDACRDRLDRLPALLKRFRQSILAAATSGRLTEDWRNTAGTELQAWREESFGKLINEMRNGLSPKPAEHPPGAKILRISAVRSGTVDLDDHRYLEVDQATRKQYGLEQDDLLITRYNGSLEFVGVCARISTSQADYVYPDKLIRVRVNNKEVLPAFIEIVFGSQDVRTQIENFVKSSAGQKGISGGDLKTTRIQVPALAEQQEIVRRVEILFAFADRLEARLATARKQVEQLTPALLAKAFRGELVAQDPADEPASELLKRLAVQRAAAPKTGRGSKAAKV